MDSKTVFEKYQNNLEKAVFGELDKIQEYTKHMEGTLNWIEEEIDGLNNDKVLDPIKNRHKDLKSYNYQMNLSIEKAIKHLQSDLTKIDKNIVQNSSKKEIAELIRTRIESCQEPKLPKYLSYIGTAMLPSGSIIFGSVYYISNDILVAFIGFLLMLSFGLSFIFYSLSGIKKYDQDIRDLHKSYNAKVTEFYKSLQVQEIENKI